MSETVICIDIHMYIDIEPIYFDFSHKSSEIFQKPFIQFAIKIIYYF